LASMIISFFLLFFISWFLCSAMQYFKLASHLLFIFNLVLEFLVSICFIWNNLWILKFISISFSFDLFYSSDLIFILILLVVIYVIWNNFYNLFFLTISLFIFFPIRFYTHSFYYFFCFVKFFNLIFFYIQFYFSILSWFGFKFFD
jgi:hypothetical protein